MTIIILREPAALFQMPPSLHHEHIISKKKYFCVLAINTQLDASLVKNPNKGGSILVGYHLTTMFSTTVVLKGAGTLSILHIILFLVTLGSPQYILWLTKSDEGFFSLSEEGKKLTLKIKSSVCF